MSDAPRVAVCLTTVADQEQARNLAERLVAERLAACVQIDGPIESHYCWEGKVECEREYRLVIKTCQARMIDLRNGIAEMHPYDQPQIVTLSSIDVDPGYASWVEQQTDHAET